MGAEFVEAARARGLSESRVLFKHVLRNSLIAMVTVLGVNIGFLISGAVVIETVFSLPGIGRLIVLAINQRDFPVVQASVLYVAVIYTVINLITDLSYLVLDPRVRYS